MQPQILVPLDGSPLAETILPYAAALARVTGSTLTLVQVLLPPVDHDPIAQALPATDLDAAEQEAAVAGARAYLSGVAGRLEDPGLAVYPVVTVGDPAGAIVGWAARDPALRMVAMATHGRSGLRRWVLGSVTEKVLHAIACPLLLVRAPETRAMIPARPYRTIVVPLDGSPLAEQALGQVLPLAKASRATLILVAVAPPLDLAPRAAQAPEATDAATELAWVPAARQEAAIHLARYLGQTAERLQATGVRVETRLIHDHPAEGILSLSDEVRADLIAMSTHGRGGIQRFWLGSIALKVVQSAHRPVLLVRA